MEDKYLYLIVALVVAFGVIILSRRINIRLPGLHAKKDDSSTVGIDSVSESEVRVKDKNSGDISIKNIKKGSIVDVDRN
jgi:hypothetical protein